MKYKRIELSRPTVLKEKSIKKSKTMKNVYNKYQKMTLPKQSETKNSSSIK
jgi:hypothetical protein